MYKIFILSAIAIAIVSGKIVPCYYRSWKDWDEGHSRVGVQNLDTSLCTNIIYSFAGLDVQNHIIKSLDTSLDLPEGRGLYLQATNLKKANPNLKVTLAIGGWSEGSKNYSDLVNEPKSRATFVKYVVPFLQQYNFDGLDFDWEFPAARGGIPSDKQAFVELCRELKAAFQPHGLLLTAALTTDPSAVDKAYDVPALAQSLDYFHIMSYDYHNSGQYYTGANTPLHGENSLENSINYYKKIGTPLNKMIIGMPTYGLTYILVDPNQAYMGAPTTGKGFSGPWSKTEGLMGYNEICIKLKDGGWRTEYDSNTATAFAVNGKEFISFDDQRSIKEKVTFALNQGVAGVMVWSVDMDDVYNDCGAGTFPLMRAINQLL